MTEYGICVTCRAEVSNTHRDECMQCYYGPFGTAWEEESMRRLEETGTW